MRPGRSSSGCWPWPPRWAQDAAVGDALAAILQPRSGSYAAWQFTTLASSDSLRVAKVKLPMRCLMRDRRHGLKRLLANARQAGAAHGRLRWPVRRDIAPRPRLDDQIAADVELLTSRLLLPQKPPAAADRRRRPRSCAPVARRCAGTAARRLGSSFAGAAQPDSRRACRPRRLVAGAAFRCRKRPDSRRRSSTPAAGSSSSPPQQSRPREGRKSARPAPSIRIARSWSRPFCPPRRRRRQSPRQAVFAKRCANCHQAGRRRLRRRARPGGAGLAPGRLLC